ncbi:hypothetical protein SAMN04488518_113122 [Pseudovibrio ascidiaceicola]|uniref:LemA family protein n=1 Tax=Pseudovibrio ascidiaceicola TaxID=285279 RepID=A0A1I4E4F5_9HYPH|nr:hypothetical protein [Pseudovibrio ascidiaceicola]SFK99477.1 hypothetical protein SAMN04488518_113122 [Pseudovibrio ascidiaceicola]
MNSRTFFLLSLCLFCAVLIVIPFWAQYFKVTGVDGRVIEWLQVLAGFSALAIGAVTLYFVTIQLTKADDQLTKANEQLVKADLQISLAHKQLELADAQLALARKDSAILTLQLRAAAFAAVETEIALMEKVFQLLNDARIEGIASAFQKMNEENAHPSVVDIWDQRIRKNSRGLTPEFAALHEQITNNVEPAIAHLSDILYADREEFVHQFHMLSIYIRSISKGPLDSHDHELEDRVQTTAANYYNVIVCIGEAYKSHLEDAKRAIELPIPTSERPPSIMPRYE